MNLFFITTGIPGAGKSTFRDNNFKVKPFIICPDEAVEMYTEKNPWTPKRGKEAWRVSDAMVKTATEEVIKEVIFFDATNVAMKRRRKYINIAKKVDFHPVSIYINTEFKTCAERNDQRDEYRKVPHFVLKRMSGSLVSPTTDEGFHTVIDVERKIVYHTGCECLDRIKEVVDLSQFNFTKGN